MDRRSFLMASAGLTALGASAAETGLFKGPLKVVVPAPAGAAPDILSRKIGDQLARVIGQPVVVDNKVGARGAIGMGEAARARPDGQTLVMGYASAFCIEPALNSKFGFDPVRDFSAVALVATLSPAIVVRGGLPIKTMAEFIDYARKNPEKLNVGTSTSTNILLAAMLEQAAGIKLYKVPYASSGDARVDLLAGRIDVFFDPPASVVQYIKAGSIRAIAVFDPQRNHAIAEVPTVAETGFPSLTFVGWNGLLGPKGMPDAAIQLLNREVRKIMSTPEMKPVLESLGVNAGDVSAAEFGQLISTSVTRFTEVAERTGIRM